MGGRPFNLWLFFGLHIYYNFVLSLDEVQCPCQQLSCHTLLSFLFTLLVTLECWANFFHQRNNKIYANVYLHVQYAKWPQHGSFTFLLLLKFSMSRVVPRSFRDLFMVSKIINKQGVMCLNASTWSIESTMSVSSLHKPPMVFLT